MHIDAIRLPRPRPRVRLVGAALAVASLAVALAGCEGVAGLGRFRDCKGAECTDTGDGGNTLATGTDTCGLLGSCDETDPESETRVCTEYEAKTSRSEVECATTAGAIWREGQRCPRKGITLGCEKGGAGACTGVTVWQYGSGAPPICAHLVFPSP